MSEESSDPPSSSSALVALTTHEARVLGCLLEKEATTPDQYPLSPNALHSACNQSSNREPVMDLGTDEVEEATEGLRYKKLSILVHQSGARVAKTKHTLENHFPSLTDGQRALLCVLLLRGQQTVGELRQRTERMHSFSGIDKVQAALDLLAQNEPAPLVRMIPSGGGRRVVTYIQTLSDVQTDAPAAKSEESAPPPNPIWREEMEKEITSLRSELSTLKEDFAELKRNLGV